MRKTMLGAVLALAAITASASGVRDIEHSAVVNGSIVVAQDGSVQSAVIDNPEKYGQPIADMVRNAALTWRFHPVLRDGQPVVAKASMHARVVLKKTAEGGYTARIKGASFGDSNTKSTDALREADGDRRLPPPHYPDAAVRYRVQGTVYMALHVDRSGHVTDAVAVQVNLGNIGTEHELAQFRQIFAQTALTTARQWTFDVPTTGPLAHQDSWTADLPFNFNMVEIGHDKPDPVWQTYVPGPYTPAPWVDKADVDAADAVADDGVRTEGAGPTLLSRISHD